MSNVTGTCRLHGGLGELRDSHIIPRWTYRRMTKLASAAGAGPGGIVQIADGTAMISGTQISEHLLCPDCEQKVGRWETHVASLALQPDDSFPALDSVLLLPDGDLDGFRVADGTPLPEPEKIVLFATSVVWRASVSTRFPKVSLGSRYEQDFREYLQGKATMPSNVRLLVQLIDPKAGPRSDRLVVHPESKRDGGHHVHQFAVFGMHFYVAVGGQLPTICDQFCFAKTKRVLVSDGRMLLGPAAKSATSAQHKGKLAKRGSSS